MAQSPETPICDRRSLPPLFPQWVYPLPADVKARVNKIAIEHGDDPADVMADLLALAADDLEGPVMDERELGYRDAPWEPQPAPGTPPAAPDPARGPQPAPQAPPSGGRP